MKEFVDFLGSQAPYDALDPDDLLTLAGHLEVEYFAAGAMIVEDGAAPLTHLWVIRTGAVDVLDRGRVVDQLGPGDTFGHVSVLSRLAPALAVRAAEDSLCLRVPDPRTILRDPERLRFTHYGVAISRERLTREGFLTRGARSVRELMRPMVWCDAGDRVSAVARLIGDGATSCALVRSPAGIGIVTDRDFREQVATGAVRPDAPIADLTTFPALTLSEDFTQAAAFARMVELGIHHLVVTGPMYQPVGVIRVVDFASAEIRNPLIIRAAIESAASLVELVEACRLLPSSMVELADIGVPALHVGNLLASVVDAILRKLLVLADDGSRLPQRSWIVLGSMARREPLLRSDVDTAVVWADLADTRSTDTRSTDTRSTEAPDGPAEVAATIRAQAETLLTEMEQCQLRRCDDGANATAGLFSHSEYDWRRLTQKWLADPGGDRSLLLSSITIDSRPLTNVVLGRTLTNAMRTRRTNEFLQAFLLESVALKPPTGFVRDFVVEHSGEHRGQLDLKRGGLVPIASIGRWVVAVTGDSRGSTVDRLRRGADERILTRDEADTLIGAFEQVYGLLLHRDVEAIRTGAATTSFISPNELDSLTRRHLRESFRAIGTVQSSVEAAWLNRLHA